MNKKIKNLFLAGVLVLGFAGVAVSCTDYDDDINALKQTNTELSAKIADLQSQITACQTNCASARAALETALKKYADDADAVVLAAAKVAANEAYLKALQEAKAYADELAATKVDKSVYDAKMAELDSKIAAIEGDITKLQGDVTALQEALKIQKEAFDNFKALVEEKLAKLEGDVTELKTKVADALSRIEVLEGKVAAAEEAIAKNAEDIQKLYDAVKEISEEVDQIAEQLNTLEKKFDSRVTSLVFIPQVYVDGVEGMESFIYNYSELAEDGLDTKEEVWTPGDSIITINPGVVAEYHVNPTTAEIDSTWAYEFVVNQEGNTPFYVTRGEASADFAVVPTFNSYEDGILAVDVAITGHPADSEYISVVALKATKTDTTDAYSVVSDYATLYENIVPDLVIANLKANTPIDTWKDVADQHYRTILGAEDTAAYITTAPWNELYGEKDYDTVVVAGTPLDLEGIVAGHSVADDSEFDLEKYGLTWDFSLVEYVIDEVEQNDYVALDGTKLTVNPKKGQAADGRTPIVRVKLLNGESVVKVAYIKVLVVVNDEYVVDPRIDDEDKDTNTFLFSCDSVATLTATVEQMKAQIYDKVDMTDEEFNAMYTLYEDVDTLVGTSELKDTLKTKVIVWTLPMDSVWAWSGKNIEKHVTYYTEDSLKVNVKLVAKVADIQKTFNLAPGPDYIDEYWWGPDRETETGYDLTKFNVRVPNVEEDTPDSCVFVNDLNAAFVTKDGKTVIDERLSGLEFFFCGAKDGVGTITKIDDVKNLKFEVVDDTVLVASGTYYDILAAKDTTITKDTIAVICNSGEAVPFNYITYNKNSNFAKHLLNTDAMYTYIGARAYYCEDETKEVAITFDGKDHFRGDFIRPVYIVNETPEHFIDAVDFGEKGSYIDVAKLISPWDWRNRNFVDYENYWGYYGPFNITINTDDVTCDLNGTRQAVPATIVLNVEPDGWNGLTSTGYGFLTYKNNGNNVSTFHLYVPVTVEYGWGVIKTQDIQILVEGTDYVVGQ